MNMRLFLVGSLVVLLTALFCVTTVYGHEKVANSYFSLKAPHAWKYAEHSNTEMAQILGIGPANQIILVPSQFNTILLDDNYNDGGMRMYEMIYDSGAFCQFVQDTDYNKEGPLASYIEYLEKKYPYFSIISQTDSTVGKEKAVKLEGSDISGTIKIIFYLMLHNDAAYNLDYVANDKDFDKYLPEFEEMIKSFRFSD